MQLYMVQHKASQVHAAAQGDWGTQFGMLTQHMSELRPGGLAEVGQEDISDLLQLYKCASPQTRRTSCVQSSALPEAQYPRAIPHDGRCGTSENICTHSGLECRESKRRFDEEEDFKARAREAVTKLQAGDPAFLEAWRLLCEISRKVCACQVLRRAGWVWPGMQLGAASQGRSCGCNELNDPAAWHRRISKRSMSDWASRG